MGIPIPMVNGITHIGAPKIFMARRCAIVKPYLGRKDAGRCRSLPRRLSSAFLLRQGTGARFWDVAHTLRNADEGRNVLIGQALALCE